MRPLQCSKRRSSLAFLINPWDSLYARRADPVGQTVFQPTLSKGSKTCVILESSGVCSGRATAKGWALLKRGWGFRGWADGRGVRRRGGAKSVVFDAMNQKSSSVWSSLRLRRNSRLLKLRHRKEEEEREERLFISWHNQPETFIKKVGNPELSMFSVCRIYLAQLWQIDVSAIVLRSNVFTGFARSVVVYCILFS